MQGKRFCFLEFELDFGRFQLCRRSKPVRIETLPLQLLMLLVESPGLLLTREQIADRLWGKDVFVDVEQGINTAVRKIRQALKDNSSQPQYLQTVVGKGYRFVAPVEEKQESQGGSVHGAMFTAEELGRAIKAAAGIDSDTPKTD